MENSERLKYLEDRYLAGGLNDEQLDELFAMLTEDACLDEWLEAKGALDMGAMLEYEDKDLLCSIAYDAPVIDFGEEDVFEAKDTLYKRGGLSLSKKLMLVGASVAAVFVMAILLLRVGETEISVSDMIAESEAVLEFVVECDDSNTVQSDDAEPVSECDIVIEEKEEKEESDDIQVAKNKVLEQLLSSQKRPALKLNSLSAFSVETNVSSQLDAVLMAVHVEQSAVAVKEKEGELNHYNELVINNAVWKAADYASIKENEMVINSSYWEEGDSNSSVRSRFFKSLGLRSRNSV